MIGRQYVISLKLSPTLLEYQSYDADSVRKEVAECLDAVRGCIVEVVIKDNQPYEYTYLSLTYSGLFVLALYANNRPVELSKILSCTIGYDFLRSIHDMELERTAGDVIYQGQPNIGVASLLQRARGMGGMKIQTMFQKDINRDITGIIYLRIEFLSVEFLSLNFNEFPDIVCYNKFRQTISARRGIKRRQHRSMR